jgi:hypothetical protein
MVSVAEYFAANRYTGKFQIGDRVFGHWNKIPFMGSVGNDSVVNEEIGPQVSIHLDLPIMYEGKIRNIIHVKPKAIKKLICPFDPPLATKSKKTVQSAKSTPRKKVG